MKERSLKDLFHRIGQVLPDTQEKIMFSPDKPVIEALKIMRENNISQVPIVEGVEVLGVFSYRSLSNGLISLPAKERDPLSLPVEVFIDDLIFANISSGLAELVDEFDLKDAVLVGTENRLQGIVTTIDVLRYFYQVASPYIMLREIELATRELIRISVSEEVLGLCIEKILREYYEKSKQSVPTCLEEMTFHDYVMLLHFKGTWEHFQPAFGGTTVTVNAKLQPIPELRNNVFHFRKEISVEEYDTLRSVRNWLLKRIRKIEATRKIEKNDRDSNA